LRPGQETVLSWDAGAVDCRVVASAGAYILLQLGRGRVQAHPEGICALTYLDGMTPMGWEGEVEPGMQDGEVRFRLTGAAADRRSSVRLPITAEMQVKADSAVDEAKMLDISAGGMRFRHSGHFRSGEMVRINGKLPGGPMLDANAVVRASEPGLCSVEFTSMYGATVADLGAWTVSMLRASLSGVG
jgi:hypothetical protein